MAVRLLKFGQVSGFNIFAATSKRQYCDRQRNSGLQRLQKPPVDSSEKVGALPKYGGGLSPREILKEIDRKGHDGNALGRAELAVAAIEKLNQTSLRQFSGEEVCMLIRLSFQRRGQAFVLPSPSHREAVEHLAKLCTLDIVSQWTNSSIFQITTELMQRGVESYQLEPLVARCRDLLETELSQADSAMMVAAASIFQQVRAENYRSPRMLEIVTGWADLEFTHLQLDDLLSIAGSCMCAGMPITFLAKIDDSFASPTKTMRQFTADMLYTVDPDVMAHFCSGMRSQRYQCYHIPLAQYLFKAAVQNPRCFVKVLEMVNIQKSFPEALLGELAAYVDDNLVSFSGSLLGRLFRVLTPRESSTKVVMRDIQKKVFDHAVDGSLNNPHVLAPLLYRACSSGLTIEDDTFHKLATDCLDLNRLATLCEVRYVVWAIQFRCGPAAPVGLLRSVWTCLDKLGLTLINFKFGVQCIAGMASMGVSHKPFLSTVVEFAKESLPELLKQGQLRHVSRLAVPLCKWNILDKPLANALAEVANSVFQNVFHEHGREPGRSGLESKLEYDALLPKKRMLLNPHELINIVAYCSLHSIFPMPAFRVLGKLKEADIRKFRRLGLERACNSIWTLAPLLGGLSGSKEEVDPAIQDRFFTWCEFLADRNFLNTVGQTLLELSRNDRTCIQHTVRGRSNVRLHFALLLSRMGNALNSWKEVEISAADDLGKKTPQGMIRIGVLCIDSSKDMENSITVVKLLYGITLKKLGWQLVVIDKAAWPQQRADCAAHVKVLLSAKSGR